MAITTDETIFDSCDSSSGFSLIGSNVGGLGTGAGGQNGITPKQGTNTVEFHGTGGTPGLIGLKTPLKTGGAIFDLTQRELSMWFLNPKTNQAAVQAELIAANDRAVRIRVFSSQSGAERWAEYDQTRYRLGDGNWQGGWLYLRCSGFGNESANSGTWTLADAQNINAVALMIDAQNNNDNKNALEYQMDYIKHYSKINIDGFNGGTTPWTLADILAESLANEWGVVESFGNYYKFFCGLEFGDGTAGAFTAENEYIYLDHSSRRVKYDVTIENNFTVTCGAKNTAGAVEDYAESGVQIVATEDAAFLETPAVKCAPAFTVRGNAAEFNAYACLLQGFGTVSLGDATTNPTIEALFGDFYDSDSVEFRTTGLTIDACRFHTESTDKQDLGVVFQAPALFSRVTVFNCIDGIVFRVSYNGADTVDRYVALGGTTFDVGVLEGELIELKDSIFDRTKVARVT